MEEAEITGDMVSEALERARCYIIETTGVQRCMNFAAKPSEGCDCIFELRTMCCAGKFGKKKKNDTHYLVCEEMANWFNTARSMENALDAGDVDSTHFREKFADCVWIKEQNSGRAHTKFVDLIWPRLCLSGDEDAQTSRGWDVWEWDVSDSTYGEPYHATMCLPTTLLVWQMVVGGDRWEEKNNPGINKWKSRDYKSILMESGRNAEQRKKQKMKQRFFYARIADYLEAPGDAKQIRFKHCLATFQSNNWSLGVEPGIDSIKVLKSRMRHKWNKWRLNTLHVIRGGSEMAYNQRTQDLVARLKIKASTILPCNVDFLEKVFSWVLQSGRRRLSRVSRDKELLFLTFKACTSVRNALDNFYGPTGEGSKRGEIKEFMESNAYHTGIYKADEDITKCLISMIGDGCRQVAYQTSLLVTKVHKPQEAHIDYDAKSINPQRYMVAFLPLTTTGQFLQLWEKEDSVPGAWSRGEIIFIPRGQLVLVPGDAIHGGGFRAEHRNDMVHAHMRLHFYVYPGESECMVDRHKNAYLNPGQNKYLFNEELQNTTTALATTFFHGKTSKNKT